MNVGSPSSINGEGNDMDHKIYSLPEIPVVYIFVHRDLDLRSEHGHLPVSDFCSTHLQEKQNQVAAAMSR